MSKLESIENDIRSLGLEELTKLRDWFFEYDAEVWDAEIEADAVAGKLDAMAEEALKEHEAGKTTPL